MIGFGRSRFSFKDAFGSIRNGFVGFFIFVIILVIGFGFGVLYKSYLVQKEKDQNTEVAYEDGIFTNHSEVTILEVKSRLHDIGELSTYEDEYNVVLGKEDVKYLLEDIKLPWTKNSIEISCNGVVKIGYELSEIKVELEGKKIFISIPEAKVNDNYVIWDSIEVDERNNITNPIEFSQYQELILEIEKLGLEDAKEKHVFDRAEANLKRLIEAFLGEFEGYTIVYM